MKPGFGEVLLAEGDPRLREDEERLVEEFRRQLDEGMWAAVPTISEGSGRREAQMVRDFAEIPTDAERRLRDLVPEGELEITSNSPPAHVATGSPLFERLRAAGDFRVEPKQAWTPVAEFAAHGLDAVNLGPGATRYAHTRDERVEIAALRRTYDALLRFAGTVAA